MTKSKLEQMEDQVDRIEDALSGTHDKLDSDENAGIRDYNTLYPRRTITNIKTFMVRVLDDDGVARQLSPGASLSVRFYDTANERLRLKGYISVSE